MLSSCFAAEEAEGDVHAAGSLQVYVGDFGLGFGTAGGGLGRELADLDVDGFTADFAESTALLVTESTAVFAGPFG